MYRKDEVNIASVRHHQQLYVNMSQKYLFLPVCRTIAKLFCCVRLVVLVVAGMAGVLGDASVQLSRTRSKVSFCLLPT